MCVFNVFGRYFNLFLSFIIFVSLAYLSFFSFSPICSCMSVTFPTTVQIVVYVGSKG